MGKRERYREGREKEMNTTEGRAPLFCSESQEVDRVLETKACIIFLHSKFN